MLGEVHARIGGGWIHRMLPHARAGLEPYGAVYDDALGRSVELPALTRAAATRYFAPPAGRVTAVEGWAEVAAHPAVLHAELRLAPGDTVSGFRSGGDRVGAVVVGADTPRRPGNSPAHSSTPSGSPSNRPHRRPRWPSPWSRGG